MTLEVFFNDLPVFSNEIDCRVATIFKELESLMSAIDDPSKGLEFKKTVLTKLNELKMTIGDEKESVFSKIVCSLLAAVILYKDQQTRWKVSRNMIDNISKVHDDSVALFISFIMKLLTIKDNENRRNIRLELEKRMEDKSIKRFRKTLYEDILQIK